MQLSLFGTGEAGVGAGLTHVRRLVLDGDCFLDYAVGFVRGHEALYGRLRERMAWKSERRVMYEREVDVPRLFACAPDDGPLDPVLRDAGQLLGQHYDATFERVGMAYYRDGRDSVAWHRDKMPRDRPTLVCIISLGAPRRFMIRPFGGGPSRSFALGQGDLLVLGGLCQLRWEHCVPKQAHAEPRISCMFRHVYA